MDRKFCPFCGEENKVSTVFYAGSSQTLVHESKVFDDEQGTKHVHYANRVTRSYQCSNFHHWEETGIPECPADGCEHGGDFEVKRLEPLHLHKEV